MQGSAHMPSSGGDDSSPAGLPVGAIWEDEISEATESTGGPSPANATDASGTGRVAKHPQRGLSKGAVGIPADLSPRHPSYMGPDYCGKLVAGGWDEARIKQLAAVRPALPIEGVIVELGAPASDESAAASASASASGSGGGGKADSDGEGDVPMRRAGPSTSSSAPSSAASSSSSSSPAPNPIPLLPRQRIEYAYPLAIATVAEVTAAMDQLTLGMGKGAGAGAGTDSMPHPLPLPPQTQLSGSASAASGQSVFERMVAAAGLSRHRHAGAGGDAVSSGASASVLDVALGQVHALAARASAGSNGPVRPGETGSASASSSAAALPSSAGPNTVTASPSVSWHAAASGDWLRQQLFDVSRAPYGDAVAHKLAKPGTRVDGSLIRL